MGHGEWHVGGFVRPFRAESFPILTFTIALLMHPGSGIFMPERGLNKSKEGIGHGKQGFAASAPGV